MGFTSSRNRLLTNAYTNLILLVEGNVLSSWVLSENLTLIVAFENYIGTAAIVLATGYSQSGTYPPLLSQQPPSFPWF